MTGPRLMGVAEGCSARHARPGGQQAGAASTRCPSIEHEIIQHHIPSHTPHSTSRTIGSRILLYTWNGTQSELAPVLLLSHLDVAGLAVGRGPRAGVGEA